MIFVVDGRYLYVMFCEFGEFVGEEGGWERVFVLIVVFWEYGNFEGNLCLKEFVCLVFMKEGLKVGLRCGMFLVS